MVVRIDVASGSVQVLTATRESSRTSRSVLMCEVDWTVREYSDSCDRAPRPLGYTISTIVDEPLPEMLARYHAILAPVRRVRSRVDRPYAGPREASFDEV